MFGLVGGVAGLLAEDLSFEGEEDRGEGFGEEEEGDYEGCGGDDQSGPGDPSPAGTIDYPTTCDGGYYRTCVIVVRSCGLTAVQIVHT